ncbi:MAG: dephospho-CoA kinase, partial [Defluviitaleaceae bacterium]|nr:dephospho-CoA kinase [Defluviitaleaceae bacterium]
MTQSKGSLAVIGLTGNSGSGKSAIAGICAEYGAYVINADEVNHENMAAGKPAYQEICAAFGTNILDEHGEINRRVLGGIVFADKAKLQALVDITHKHVIAETRRRINEAMVNPTKYKFIVKDAPLLIEAGMHKECDETWLAVADYGTRLQRIRSRDGLSDEHIANRFASQTPQAEL